MDGNAVVVGRLPGVARPPALFEARPQAQTAPRKRSQEEVKFHVPEVGYLFLILSIRDFRIGLVGVPVVIIGLLMLTRLWREAGVEARRQKLAESGWRSLLETGSGAVLEPVEIPAVRQIPARVDLGRRRARAGPTAAPSGRATARPRVDLSLPLRVRRLAQMQVVGALAGTPASSVATSATPAPDASIAAVRLLVSRISR